MGRHVAEAPTRDRRLGIYSEWFVEYGRDGLEVWSFTLTNATTHLGVGRTVEAARAAMWLAVESA